MTRHLGSVRLRVIIRHCVFSFSSFGLRTVEGLFLGGRVGTRSEFAAVRSESLFVEAIRGQDSASGGVSYKLVTQIKGGINMLAWAVCGVITIFLC